MGFSISSQRLVGQPRSQPLCDIRYREAEGGVQTDVGTDARQSAQIGRQTSLSLTQRWNLSVRQVDPYRQEPICVKTEGKGSSYEGIHPAGSVRFAGCWHRTLHVSIPLSISLSGLRKLRRIRRLSWIWTLGLLLSMKPPTLARTGGRYHGILGMSGPWSWTYILDMKIDLDDDGVMPQR